MESATPVPYQPYRSKRHSRTPSAPRIDSPPRPTPPPQSPPQPSKAAQKAPAAPEAPVIQTEPQAPPPAASSPTTNGHTRSESASSSPSTSARTLTPPPPQPAPQHSQPAPQHPPPLSPRTSTFKRIPPRTRTSSAPLTPSPLRPDYVSKSSTPSPAFSRQSSSFRRLDSNPTVPNGSARPLMSSPLARPPEYFAAPKPVSAIPHPPIPTPTPSTPATPKPVTSLPVSSSPVTPAASLPQSPSPIPKRASAPYRPGFQPKGVYRPRTDEFLAARNAVRDRGKIEERRLERRLEKLIQLHFPQDSGSPSSEKASAPPKPPPSRRASSIFDIDLRRHPSDLWRDVIEPRIQGPKAAIRAEEQNITPWEDDAAVQTCPLCSTSFHPLTNRKHHCRLCGRIICSLPVKPPQRTQQCSILFVVDQKTRRIEEVGEGVDYGVRRRTLSMGGGTANNGKGKGTVAEEEDKFLKGVRVCRECRPLLLRQQYLQDAHSTPTFVRLYEYLIQLEKEIEDALPQFQELILSLSTPSTPSTPTAEHSGTTALRKRLLDSFAEYDKLAKRIRNLPAEKGCSQDRVQAAILTRATLFLQKNMFPLQALPKPPKKSPNGTPDPSKSASAAKDVDSELALTLQPLLEQEALLETFVEEAKAQRKFEDAKTLKANLEEIRGEIEKVAREAGAF